MENISTLKENSVPQSENILPQTDRFCPYDRICKQFFCTFLSLFRQTENIIGLVENIYSSTDSDLLSTELYNYAPLIGHEFHFVWLTASHKQSPIEGIGIRFHLSDPFVGSLQVKILIFFT